MYAPLSYRRASYLILGSSVTQRGPLFKTWDAHRSAPTPDAPLCELWYNRLRRKAMSTPWAH